MNNISDLSTLQHISPEDKRRLTARLLRERSGAAADPYPLSHNQRSLYVLYRLDPASAAYHVSFPLRLLDRVNVDAMRRACQALIERHPQLRARFFERGGEPMQAMPAGVEVAFEHLDLTGLPAEEQHQRLNAAYRRPFDLAAGPVARFTLATRGAEDHVLLPVVHHIAIDGHSILIILRELGALYRQCSAGLPARLPLLVHGYDDFVHQQELMLAGPNGERLWLYWRDRLAGELPVLDLPTDLPRPPSRGDRCHTVTVTVAPELTARLKALAKSRGVTLFTLMLAAYQVLLHRHSGQEDILVGCPDGSRPGPEYNPVVGYFVNPMIVRGDLSGNPPFTDLLANVARDVIDGFAHREMPFAVLVERLGLGRDPSRTPLFQAAFNFLQLVNGRARTGRRGDHLV